MSRPAPQLPPAEVARRAREWQRFQQQQLAKLNYLAQVIPFSPALLTILRSPFLDMRAKVAPTGPDSFMPTSFWRSQNPDGKSGWANCANTVYAMLSAYQGKSYHKPTSWYDLVVEHQTAARQYNFPIRDYYMRAPALRAGQGMQRLNEYMALHKPVMVGVSHTLNFYLEQTSKTTHITTHTAINGGTIDHFIAIVGMGVDKKGPYYRFFDVGTQYPKKGTDARNKLYYNSRTGFYEGKSFATGNDYILTQLRF